jgi:hypothetical protein
MADGGNVRTLISQFNKEKPSILLIMIADDVSSDFMRKKFDETVDWNKLSDSEKEKYNTDYKLNKNNFDKYLINEFVKLYYSDNEIKNKCKGTSRSTINAIKSVMVKLAKEYPKTKYDDGGMMAEGGMTEHGLKQGDMIINQFDNVVVVQNEGKTFVVNLNVGKRWSENQWLSLNHGESSNNSKMADGGMMANGGEMMADGGMMARGGYNYGSAWTKDRNEYNKSESYEIPLSQRKMEMGGKLNSVKVIFQNPKYNYTTNVSANTTEQDARDYFVGKMFDVGTYPNENMQRVIDVEYNEYSDTGLLDMFSSANSSSSIGDNMLNQTDLSGFSAHGGSLGEYYKKKSYRYDEGGYVDENTEMLMSQVKEIKHHTQEIESILNKNTKVESWVLAKAERSSTDLSDITHYLDGKVQEMEKGGRYNTGRAWTLDHNQHNKSEDYEVPNRNRKMADGGMIEVGDLVRVKKYGWIMRVVDFKDGFYFLENDRRGTMNGNAGGYLPDDIVSIKMYKNGGDVKELEIEFEEEDNDILVEYKIKIDDKELEIFGKLKTYNSGRGENYQFEPDYFSDSDSEKFYDENWELVEDQIINAYDTKYADGGLMAKGGSIPNNYRGRTTEDIWNNLSENQRTHFMLDHFNELFILENEVVIYANKEFKSLNENIQNVFKVHTIMGQYADGGEIDEDDMNVKFIDYKGKSIMFEPHFKKYYSNDVEFDSIEKAKKYIDSGSKSPDWERLAYKRGMMARGGKTKIKSYKEYKEELINIANKSNSESEFVDKAKSSLKEYIPMYFSDVRMDIFGIKDADWNKMIKSPSKYSKELESVSLGNAYNKLKSSSKSTSKVKESKDEYKDDRRMSKAKTYWNTFNENNRGQYLLSAGYSKIESENLSKNSWDSLDKEVHMRLRSVLLADGGMMVNGGEVLFGDLKIGEEYYQVTRPELGIEKIKITEKQNGAYSYVSDKRPNEEEYVTKYQGKYQENEKLFGIYFDKNLAKKKAFSLLEERMSKYANGGYMAEGGKLSKKDKDEFLDELYSTLGGENVYVVERENDVQLSTNNRPSLSDVINRFSPTGRTGFGGVSTIDEVEIDGDTYYYLTIDYRKIQDDKMAKGGISDSDIYYGVVDSNNKLVFQSKSEREAKLVSNSYEGSVVKKYKGKANINKYDDGGEIKSLESKLKNSDNEIQIDGNKLKIQKKENPTNFLTITQVGKDSYNINVTSGTIQNPSNAPNATWFNLRDKYHTYNELLLILKRYGVVKMVKGGVTFDEKVKSISASQLKRKKVSPSVQKDYGKTYSKKEAVESAKRIAGAMRAKEIRMKKK